MARLDVLPVGADTDQWPVWSTTARLVVRDPATLADARRVVDGVLVAVDTACSRFRPSELSDVNGTALVSPLLAELVDAALTAAELTAGDVDPTLGVALADLGYDRDIDLLTDDDVPIVVRRLPDWRGIRLRGRELTVPDGVRLDLGATAKAFAADRCARLVEAHCGTGVLVSLGGDIATAGDGDWTVLVSDGLDQPECVITLRAGGALATSSTISRTWRRDGQLLHHILDPRTCLPARGVWRTVSVAADSCVTANTWTTAAIVRGASAPDLVRRLGLPARFVARDGSVLGVGTWPL
jgi:thiamine biosynthesis lipoprotein